MKRLLKRVLVSSILCICAIAPALPDENLGVCELLLLKLREISGERFNEPAPELRLTVTEGDRPRPLLDAPEIFDRLSLNSAKRMDLPPEWQDLASRGLWIVDAEGLLSRNAENGGSSNKNLQLSCARLAELEVKERIRTIATFRQQGYQARLRNLPHANRVVVTGHESVKEIAGGGERLLAILQDSPAGNQNATDGSVHVLLGHESSSGRRPLDDFLDAARNGRFRGEHIVVGVCNVSPAMMYEFVAAAIENGAKSVVAANAPIDATAYSLAVQVLRKQGQLQSRDTALDGWRRAYVDSLKLLDKCIKEPEPAQAVEREFGAIHEWPFPTGQLNKERLKSLRQRLLNDPQLFNHFVLNASIHPFRVV